LMSNRRDKDFILADAIDDRIWKPSEKKAVFIGPSLRPGAW